MNTNQAKNFIGIFLVLSITGCASGITNVQEQEYQAYEAKGLSVMEDDPGTAAALGLLPGGGSFYTGHAGLGVVNLLFWPLSILWDPISGSHGAATNNYYATQASVNRAKRKEINGITKQYEAGAITQKSYLVKKNDIEIKYSPEFL